MQQRFETKNWSVEEFQKWEESGELLLQPKFQRRDVWSDKAKSYLLDTILRGKPIPKIYLRLETNRNTKRTVREVVDGQQRLRSVLDFLKDGFKISRTHNQEHGGKYFSEIDDDAQEDVLNYTFAVDVLEDMPDAEVYDVFARLNTYSVTLNYQELRHAKYFGEFKTTAYRLAKAFMTFWRENEVFTDKQILRMAEAEFVSELLIAASSGIRAKEKRLIDSFYSKWDNDFPKRSVIEKRFRETMDSIGGIMGDRLPESKFKTTALLYPLFCAVYHLKFGLPEFDEERITIKTSNYTKLGNTLIKIDEIFYKLDAAREEAAFEHDVNAGIVEIDELEEEEIQEEYPYVDPLTPEERKFYNAYAEHWVHARNRKLLTEHICKLMLRVLKR
jgi:hypothetical protein